MTGTSTNFLSSRPNGQAYYLSTIFSKSPCSAIDSGGAGGADARAPPEFWGSEKGQSQISAYQSLAITTNTPGFEKLNTALQTDNNFPT